MEVSKMRTILLFLLPVLQSACGQGNMLLLANNLSSIYNPQNPYQAALGDNIFMMCLQNGPVYRLADQQAYDSCTVNSTSVIVGVCRTDLGPGFRTGFSLPVIFQSSQDLPSVQSFEPERMYFLAGPFINTAPEGSAPEGEMCSTGSKFAMFVATTRTEGGGDGGDSTTGGTESSSVTVPEGPDEEGLDSRDNGFSTTHIIIIGVCGGVALLLCLAMGCVVIGVVRAHKRRIIKNKVDQEEGKNVVVLKSQKSTADENGYATPEVVKRELSDFCKVETKPNNGVIPTSVKEKFVKSSDVKKTGKESPKVVIPTSAGSTAVSYQSKSVSSETTDGPRSNGTANQQDNRRNGGNAANNDATRVGGRRKLPPDPIEKNKQNAAESSRAKSNESQPPKASGNRTKADQRPGENRPKAGENRPKASDNQPKVPESWPKPAAASRKPPSPSRAPRVAGSISGQGGNITTKPPTPTTKTKSTSNPSHSTSTTGQMESVGGRQKRSSITSRPGATTTSSTSSSSTSANNKRAVQPSSNRGASVTQSVPANTRKPAPPPPASQTKKRDVDPLRSLP